VTLITGDVVRVLTRADGKRSVSLEADAGGSVPDAAITDAGRHLYVVPRSAAHLLAAGRLDRDLFDVAELIRLGYDDDRRPTMPVIVDYGRGADAAADAQSAILAGGEKTVTLPSLGAAAFAAEKKHGRAFWRSLTSNEDAVGSPTKLAGGAARVDLDGRVHALLDVSVPQIHAPAAWAAGFDGAGTTVAVLDTGYDPTHPDLQNRVTGTSNFTTDPTVVDGNGHGTHVASTIAGSGAASSGKYKGVAPGAHLLVGKVLANEGFGEDSWVLAGMQWAVAQGADVVSMSLGGEAGDGTDPLSRAIDDLSASSKTLFVVAAGNNGDGPDTITAPGAADAALTVGAVDSSDTLAYFSSRGPRLGDHALKPDVVAPGVSITAARAAGTSLGSPVDQWYTDLDGTSMATPHVAGLAAILKEEHPGWDGELLKEAVADSTVPVAGATAFDAGSGRVDAALAIADTVVTDPSLQLGFYPYPQSALAPTRKPLTYTNLGSKPVTLALAVGAEDPAAGAPAGVSLSAQSLTVPAGGQAHVDVVVDPAAAGAGDHSGVITATAAGTPTVRTAFGLSLESEHYDLTVQVKPRPGTQSANHTVALVRLDTGDYDQRELTGAGPQSVTFRLTPGTYSTGAISFGLAADEAHEGILAYQPTIQLHENTTVVLDEGAAQPFTAATDRPAWSEGQFMLVELATDAGAAGFTLTGSTDRLFATPLASKPGAAVDSGLWEMLSQPAGELTPAGGRTVGLQPLAAAGQQVWDVPVPDLRGSFPVVDAGSASAPATARVRGTVALVSGTCGDLTGTARALAAAGAAAMVAYAADGSQCAGSLDQPAPLPAFQARPFDATRLLGSRQASLLTHRSPDYIYDLVGWWPDRVPSGAVLDGSAKHVASFVEEYRSLGGTSDTGHHAWDMGLGWVNSHGVSAFGLLRPVSVPGTVTHYASPEAEWGRTVEVRTADGVPEGALDAASRTVAARETVHDRWFGGPIVAKVAASTGSVDWHSAPYREDDYLWLFQPAFADDDGHVGYPFYLGEFDGKLYVDGELAIEGDDPLWMQYFAAPERHRYELVYTSHRDNGFWQHSKDVETRWRFTSERPTADHETVPLIDVDYDLQLSSLNTARPGPFSFGVSFRLAPGAAPSPLKSVVVETSLDGGTTWSPSATRCQAASCTVQVRNPAAGAVSLRVTASDAAGRSVAQTVIGAYGIAR
jgi:subtilisin family serine protease